ncbi:MAG: sugar ABC transporter permease, partial [Actinobacteria bacterium]
MGSGKGGSGGGTLSSALFYVFLFLFVLVSVAPLLWVFKMSIVQKSEVTATPPTILPQSFTGQSYSTIFSDASFQKALINSIIIAGVTTVVCLFFGAIAAYAIARLRFNFKNLVMTLILAISFFPAVAIIAPLFIQFRAIGLINTYWSAIIADTVFALPLTIWILV